MKAMVVDKYKSVFLRWELKFFHANFAGKKFRYCFVHQHFRLVTWSRKKEGIPGNKSAQNLVVGEFL